MNTRTLKSLFLIFVFAAGAVIIPSWHIATCHEEMPLPAYAPGNISPYPAYQSSAKAEPNGHDPDHCIFCIAAYAVFIALFVAAMAHVLLVTGCSLSSRGLSNPLLLPLLLSPRAPPSV